LPIIFVRFSVLPIYQKNTGVQREVKPNLRENYNEHDSSDNRYNDGWIWRCFKRFTTR